MIARQKKTVDVELWMSRYCLNAGNDDKEIMITVIVTMMSTLMMMMMATMMKMMMATFT